MSKLDYLRELLKFQQFSELKSAAAVELIQNDSPDLLAIYIIACFRLEQFNEAEHEFIALQEKVSDLSEDGLTDLAAIYLQFFDIDKAKENLSKVLEKNPSHPLANARMGQCHLMTKDFDIAKKYFLTALENKYENVLISTNLCHIDIEQEKYDEAQSYLDQAKQLFNENKSNYPEPFIQFIENNIQELQFQLWIVTDNTEQAEDYISQLYHDYQENNDKEDELIKMIILYAQKLAFDNRHHQACDFLREYLKNFKENIQLIVVLAEISQVLGQKFVVIQLLNRALKITKKDEKPTERLPILCKLSNAHLFQNDEQALNIAKKAEKLLEELTEDSSVSDIEKRAMICLTKTSLAQAYSGNDKFDNAEKLYLEVLDENKFHCEALSGLGQLYMQLGKIDQAIEIYQQMKSIAPIQGYSALINARHFPETEEELDKIEQVAHSPSLQGKIKSNLLFQLASAWQKRKEYDKAFELLTEANEQSKQFLKYNPQTHRDECARIRASFCKALYEHRKDCGHDSTLPVYIVGMPRSGTTLLEQILSSHSQIFGAGELGVIPQVIQGLNRWERHVGSGRKYPDCIDDLNPYITNGIAENVIKQLREFSEDAKYVVDKLPHNFENVGLIKFLFPKAKIISIRRDPRDIAISNYFQDYQAKFGGMGFAYDLTNIGEQLADHNLLMHHWDQVFPGEIYEIQYEKLVEDIEGEIRKVFDYLEVEWEDQVLAFNELERSVKTASVWQVRQPVYKSSKNKWKKYQDHLAPLIKGTNAPIKHTPITDMITLPEPAWLQTGYQYYQDNQLDDAELCFKKLLHHVPDHAAASYMVGLIYLRKGHPEEGKALIEKAVKLAPWKKDWRKALKEINEMIDKDSKSENVEEKE